MIFFLVFILIWVVITAAVIAVHFWFLSLPLVCVGGGLAIRRHQRNKQLARRQPGPCDPWLNEVVVAVADLDFEERERNFTDVYFGIPLEGYVELRKQRLTVDVVLFSNQVQARNAEMAMRAESTIRNEIGREMAAIHNGGRVLIVARTKMGSVDEYDFGEIVRLVGEIPLPPPLSTARPITYRAVTGDRRPVDPTGPRTTTAMLPRPALPPVARDQDAIDQLHRLGRLHASGVLTDEEFQAKKAELLQRI
jgi:hypothetical protein